MTLEDIIALLNTGIIRIESEYDENEELHLHLYLGEGIEEAIGEHASAIHRYLSIKKRAQMLPLG